MTVDDQKNKLRVLPEKFGIFAYNLSHALSYMGGCCALFIEYKEFAMSLSPETLRWYEKWSPFIIAWSRKDHEIRKIGHDHEYCSHAETIRELRKIGLTPEEPPIDLRMYIGQIYVNQSHENIHRLKIAEKELPQPFYSDNDHFQGTLDDFLKCLKAVIELDCFFQDQ